MVEKEPRAGRDYPRDFVEFQRAFGNEELCRRYLEKLRWPDGFVCPKCGEQREPWERSRGWKICIRCGHETSVTAGTIFAGTRKPLQQWFLAAWEVTNQKVGASALGVQRALGLKSYQTAWAWLHKLRRAMVRPGRERLSGEVEVDETYVGGEESGVRGRGTNTKALVAIAVSLEKGKHIGRIRLRRVSDASAKSLVGFVRDVVSPGSTVLTDGWPSYGELSQLGFEHRVTVISKNVDPAHVVMPHVHRVASLLKRWLLGTHQGAVSRAHLDYYLDEFTFRFNRRTSKSRGLLFYRLLQQAIQTAHISAQSLSRSTRRGPRKGAPPRRTG